MVISRCFKVFSGLYIYNIMFQNFLEVWLPKHQKQNRMETKVLLSQYLQILKVSWMLRWKVGSMVIGSVGYNRKIHPVVIIHHGNPTTFIFWGYDPYIGGLKPSFFIILGSKGIY